MCICTWSLSTKEFCCLLHRFPSAIDYKRGETTQLYAENSFCIDMLQMRYEHFTFCNYFATHISHFWLGTHEKCDCYIVIEDWNILYQNKTVVLGTVTLFCENKKNLTLRLFNCFRLRIKRFPKEQEKVWTPIVQYKIKVKSETIPCSDSLGKGVARWISRVLFNISDCCCG